jgi:putative SOS response-associated peptidase YedK
MCRTAPAHIIGLFTKFVCGRYQRRSDKQRIAEAFKLGRLDGLFLELAPDYNACPGKMHPVIVWDAAEGMRTMQMMYWKFLPAFCTDPKKLKLSTTNAKADKLLESGMWKASFLERRCLIPADNFIEWHRVSDKIKLPWMFAMKDDEPFALGGLWSHWRSPDGKTQMDTFAVITVEPNELLEQTTHHDRMPLIVKRADWQRWLEPGPQERPPVELLRPFDSDLMKAWRVGTRINSVKNNDAILSEPVKDDDAEQLGMFG